MPLKYLLRDSGYTPPTRITYFSMIRGHKACIESSHCIYKRGVLAKSSVQPENIGQVHLEYRLEYDDEYTKHNNGKVSFNIPLPAT